MDFDRVADKNSGDFNLAGLKFSVDEIEILKN